MNACKVRSHSQIGAVSNGGWASLGLERRRGATATSVRWAVQAASFSSGSGGGSGSKKGGPAAEETRLSSTSAHELKVALGIEPPEAERNSYLDPILDKAEVISQSVQAASSSSSGGSKKGGPAAEETRLSSSTSAHDLKVALGIEPPEPERNSYLDLILDKAEVISQSLADVTETDNFQVAGPRIALLFFPIWLLYMLVAAKAIELPFSLPFLNT